MLGTAAVVAIGALAAWGGITLIRRCEAKPGVTRFVRFYSPVVILNSLGYILLFLGLFTAAVFAPMYWIAHPR